MARTDGRKIVAIATVATVSFVGFAQIYLPYWADRDKIRGMAEEADMPAAAKRQMLMEAMEAERQEERREQQRQR
jgi:hypothetical protein